MSRFDPHSFPRPVVVQPLDYEQAKKKCLQTGVKVFHDAGYHYTVENLETDPLVIASEAAAYGDLHFVGRLNDAARVVLLSEFAQGDDLRLKVKRSGIVALEGESDSALRERERVAQKGRSGWSDDYFKAWALSADPMVRDVKVYAETRNGVERWLVVSILSHDNNGIPTPDLLQKVAAACKDTGFKNSLLELEARAAVVRTVNITGTIYYYPEAVIPDDPGKPLLDAWQKDQQQGLDLTDDYISAKVYHAGIQRIELENWQDQFASPYEALSLGTVNFKPERLLS